MKRKSKNLPLFPDPPPDADPFFYEVDARRFGFRRIAGVDEAGRGPLAGPVVAAAVVLPETETFPGVTDSKQMTEKAREKAFSMIAQRALAVGVGVVSPRFIDDKNILNATREAMKRAVLCLRPVPDFLLIDGIYPIQIQITQRCIIRGDELSRSISAASVVAKVYRDRIMCCYHETYPQYGFLTNKGYGTSYHFDALRRHGPCPIHRFTFNGVCVQERDT